ncbi:MAG: isopentenyl-diphosphate Delta-isomerase [Myxococcota bacterium]|nr:isopentenyl-diphosphate Delta-isomerase [Myxococcota bacterium]MDP6244518.1 isopentenyl-diphosphate Delta-isomerase [Myxococcota bacterium]MDP7073330.1 isopentenyl-diphosphate Delta-isomerase [Myxococcota bacterium]MDP7301209.1 isopentenyl-diphosphate Delta-isomerase [Myxococcota bacterium]MDP7431505.1 isopentenyl-diphosphate Delta-isomerase [Myxococcota bacterium]
MPRSTRARGVELEEIILVDEQDREVGFAEKLAAHRDGGLLHRAFSIVLFDPGGDVLLQKRAAAKYHFGGLWTNACCGHPRRGEALEDAAHRRLREELGVASALRRVFALIYTAEDPGSGLTEREFDHVFVGVLTEVPQPDPAEIDGLRWIRGDELVRDVARHPEHYTPWFAELLERLPELEAALRAEPA